MTTRCASVLAFLLAASSANAASADEVECRANKLEAAAREGRSLARCHRWAALAGEPVDRWCVYRAEEHLALAFDRAEAAGGCALPADADTVIAQMRQLPDDAAGSPSRCLPARLLAMGGYAARLLRAQARYQRVPDDARLARREAAAAASFDRLLVRVGCDSGTRASAVRGLVAQVLDGGPPAQCGDGVRDRGESCDGGDDAACPGACQADCQCPAGTAFPCLSQAGRLFTVAGTHRATYRQYSLPRDARIDGRAAVFLGSPSNAYPINLAGESGVCFAGGTVEGQYARTATWDTMHSQNNAGLRFENTRFTVEGLRIDNVTDGIRPVGGAFTIRQAWLSYVRDDCIENDHLQGGVIEDSLFDGCYVGVSERPSQDILDSGADGRGSLLTIRSSLIRLEPMPGPSGGRPSERGHGPFFKWHDRGTSLALHDNVFMAEAEGEGGADAMATPASLTSCTNNTMVWLGPGRYPTTLPSCFRVTTDRRVWDDAVARWKLAHPHVGRQ